MLADLILGQYLPGRSVVHRLDPRTKLTVVASSVFAVFSPAAPWGVAGTWPLLILAVVVSGVPARRLWRGLVPFRWLFACTLVLYALTVGGHPLPGPPVAVWPTWEGAETGLVTVLRLSTAVTYATVLTLTTNPLDLVWGLCRLARPLEKVGVPVARFGVSLLIALRFLPLLVEEALVLDRVAAARGAGSGPRPRISLLARPLVERVVRRADRVARAMDARCFSPSSPPVGGGGSGFGRADLAAVGGALATLGAVVWGGGVG